jgi:antitoxin HigA-1
MSAVKNGQGERLIVKIKFIQDRFGAVLRRVGNPAVDFGLAPTRAICAYRHLRRERAFLDLPIDGRAGQAGAVEDGFKPDDAVWLGHSLGSIGCALMTPPANNLGRAVPYEKSVFGASKCSVKILANGGLVTGLFSRNTSNNRETLYAVTLRRTNHRAARSGRHRKLEMGAIAGIRMKSPVHPGGFVKSEIIQPLGLSVTAAAQVLGVTRVTLSTLLNEHSQLSSEMALRIEKAFGVSMDTLMRMQNSYDIAQARMREGEIKVARFNGLGKS